MKSEDTCFDKCRYYKKKDRCPFYMELVWNNDTGEAKTTRDCTPRRQILMAIDQDQRLLGMQQAAEQERNYQRRVLDAVVAVARKAGIELEGEGKEVKKIGS